MPDPETVGKQPDPANKGEGAGGDGQQGKFVPMARLEEEVGKRQALEVQLAELRGKVDGLSTAAPKTKPVAEKPRDFTRSELRDAVEQGKINQDQADTIWDQQQERKTGEKIASVKTEVVEEITETAKIGSQIDRYKELRPDLRTSTTEDYRKVKAEFDYMVDELKMERNLTTELAALRAIFGPVDRLTPKQKDGRPDPHQEIGGRGGGEEPGGDPDGPPRDLNARQKKYYQHQIDNGLYKGGWKDPVLQDELKRIRSGRQKAA